MKASKKRSKSVSKFTPSTILSIGHYDIDYSITLNDDDVLKFHIDDITKLSKYEDISFIIENQYLWDKRPEDIIPKKKLSSMYKSFLDCYIKLICKNSNHKLYLYDILEIKKETGKSCQT